MLVKKVSSLFLCNKQHFKQALCHVLSILLISQQLAFGASNSASSEILSPVSKAYDFTFTEDSKNDILINKTYIEVEQVIKEVEKIANALVPRDINVANCSGTGCPIDSIQCDAVTETPYCPDGSILNTTRDMCQKDPDVFNCPTGYTYDKQVQKCVRPLECPNDGVYVVERQRCEYKRIYECPMGYTQDGDTCIAPPVCPNGAVFDATLLKCTAEPVFACADTGWTYDPDTNKCFYAPPTCPTGMAYNKTYDKCLLAYTPTCASGYTYNATRTRCEKTPPDCPSGTTYNATTNRCEQGANSACGGGTWNGTNCTVGSNYVATGSASYSNCAGDTMDYADAEAYCANLVEGGYSDWRLPTLYETSARKAGGVPSCGGGTWTSTATKKVFSYTWIGSMDIYFYIYDEYFVRCVRGTNPSATPSYTCPNGGTLSGTTCLNTSTAPASCPVGYTHDGSGRCYANPTCPSSGSFDGVNDVCHLPFSKECPTNGAYDSSVDQCIAEATCTKGTLNKTLDRCEQDYIPVCSAGWAFNTTTKRCEKDPTCNVGTYNKTYDKCLLAYTPTCASGYTYNSTRTRCEKKPPDCPSGTAYNATTNRCEQGANSACGGGTWNGTNCTIGSNYAATGVYTREPASGEYYVSNHVNYAPYAWIVSNWAMGSSFAMWDNVYVNGNWQNDTHYNATSYSKGGYTYYRGSLKYQDGDGTQYGIYRIKNTPDSYTCPNGGTLSGTTCNNTSTAPASCPVGYTHDGSGRCYTNPTCPSSGSFDGDLDVCWIAFNKSCTTGTYDSASDSCLNEPNCDGGTLNPTLDKCQILQETVCNSGTKDPITQKCTFTATCQSGATLDAKGCNEEPIPLTCPSGTDTTLDVCYSHQDYCKVVNTYKHISTLAYSNPLNICTIEEDVVCASSLTWSQAYAKCEAVPICYNGMYNPENDFCYISTKDCPINPAYPCKGPIGNKWCSPYECSPKTNQCGFAECPAALPPSLTAEMNPSYNANLVYKASDTLCTSSRCDLANSSRFTYCGLEEACPSGFGVFEQNGQCYVRECPQGSFQENNKCYSLGCPKGTTEQGDGKCLVK